MGEKATCSSGVAIAHQKWPLRHALQTARDMERLAKDGLGRNAVSIAVLRRSGGHERFAARWGEEAQIRDPDPLQVLQRVADLVRSGGVSRRFAYGLREEARVLWDLPEALAERAFWLIQRHRRKGPGAPDDATARSIARDVGGLATWLRTTPLRAPRKPVGRDEREDPKEREDPEERDDPPRLERFVAAVGLAEFIARGGEGEE
jgi:CRISPR-associated protein Cmr2